MRPRLVLFLTFSTVIVMLHLPGCATYSPETVSALKARETALLTVYAGFAGEPDTAAISRELKSLEELQTLQAARGKSNMLMVSQIAEISALVQQQLDQRQKHGVWSLAAIKLNSDNLSRAFLSAVRIEEAKKKGGAQ